MNKLRTALITLGIFTVLSILVFYIVVAKPFTVKNTLDGEMPRTNIADELLINQFFNAQYKGTQTAMDWGPELMGLLTEDIMIVALGFCSDQCPENSLIVDYLMYYRESTIDECTKAWGYDLNIVSEDKRYCLFQIPEVDCDSAGGSPFYDNSLDVYVGCSLNQY